MGTRSRRPARPPALGRRTACTSPRGRPAAPPASRCSRTRAPAAPTGRRGRSAEGRGERAR
ncbi:hypothetical protein E1267_11780 [Nonomuraea longispora]|uniref:Uncharacterized protein n=1 Tax=Nonomuraea longispora TaxID=1848320 RepID=A0A4R4NKE4_9ACTN|nr:hypothetical protein E1267_11780 [Nonomuraea longispora]